MPELPDVLLYLDCLRVRLEGEVLQRVRIVGPFLLRTVDPPVSALEGKPVESLERLGKRIVLGFPDDLYAVIHLMIAGRFRWKASGAKVPAKIGLAAFDFAAGTLILTEASSQKRASLHVVRGREGLRAHERPGLDVLAADLAEFRDALTRKNHTLKRALTDQNILDGIGNAYSDEILHHARLSPFLQSQKLSEEQFTRLHESCQIVLREWIERLRAEVGDGFPERVTAFRPEMAVHGRFREPCPACGAPVQRVVYARKNEMNYCPGCQTDGRILADRVLSRLLGDDFPRTLEELEE